MAEKYDSLTKEELMALAKQVFGNAVNVELLERESLIEKLESWDSYVEKSRALTGFTGGDVETDAKKRGASDNEDN